MVQGFGKPMQLLKGEVHCFENWLYTCVMAFRHLNHAVMSVDAVKFFFFLSGFIVAVIILMCSAYTRILIYWIKFFTVFDG